MMVAMPLGGLQGGPLARFRTFGVILRIGNDPSKASSNSWEYIFAASLAGVKGLSGCAGRQNSKSDPVQKPIVLELEERPMLH